MGYGEFIFSSPVYEWSCYQSRFSCACARGGTGESSAGCYDLIEWRELCFLGWKRRLHEPVEYGYEKGKRAPGKISSRSKGLCKKEWVQRDIFHRAKTLRTDKASI